MLWFVTTDDAEGVSELGRQYTQFWIVLANNEDELKEMFNDEYTTLISCTTDVTDGLIEQYGGMAMLCTP